MEIKMTDEAYYADKSSVSHSMLCDFVSYDRFGNRTVNPFNYYAKHVARTAPAFEETDAMTVGKIVDAYFCDKEEFNRYTAVSRRSKDSTQYEVTQTMLDDATRMIEAVKGLFPFHNSVFHDKYSTQTVLYGEYESLKLKGKLDVYSSHFNHIIDLKTTASVSTLWDDLQYKGRPNIHARYIRQLAFYRMLSGNKDTTAALAVADKSGNVMWIPVRKDILDAAQENIECDLLELKSYYDSDWEALDNFDPFGKLSDEGDADVDADLIA